MIQKAYAVAKYIKCHHFKEPVTQTSPQECFANNYNDIGRQPEAE